MKIEFDALTGKVTEREFTSEELAQVEADRLAEEERLAKETAKVAQRQALLDRLGLTEEEAKLLLA